MNQLHCAVSEQEVKQMGTALSTWAGRSRFTYLGSVAAGTTIRYGANCKWSATITSEQYRMMLNKFRGRTVPCGTTREVDRRQRGSLGEWLAKNMTKTAIASYVGAILVHEGYALKAGPKIHFL